MKTNISFEIEEKEIDTILIAGFRMKGKYSDMGKGIGQLAKKLGRNINGKPLTLYYDGEYKEEDADFEPCFPIGKGKGDQEISVRELSGGKAVSLIHRGPYEKIGESYMKLFSYIHEKSYETQLPFREIYIKGPGLIFRGNSKKYMTEIIILISDPANSC